MTGLDERGRPLDRAFEGFDAVVVHQKVDHMVHSHTNPMMPYLATITSVRGLATGIKLFRVELDDPHVRANFDYRPGQFAEVSAFGVGEAPFGICSTRERSGSLEFAINRVGTVTTALHRMDVGDQIGVRGPLGNGFPMDKFKGRNIVILGGGIGGAPCARSSIRSSIIVRITASWSFFGQLAVLTCWCSPMSMATGVPNPTPSCI